MNPELRLRCYVCSVERDPLALNWELDAPGGPRCPKHRTHEQRFASLGDIILSKQRVHPK